MNWGNKCFSCTKDALNNKVSTGEIEVNYSLLSLQCLHIYPSKYVSGMIHNIECVIKPIQPRPFYREILATALLT